MSRPKFCAGSKTVADKSRKHLFPQHMLPARINWESFASAPTFSCLPDLSVFAQTHKLENFVSYSGRAGNMLLKRNLCFESKNIFGSSDIFIFPPSFRHRLKSYMHICHLVFFVIKESLVSNTESYLNYKKLLTLDLVFQAIRRATSCFWTCCGFISFFAFRSREFSFDFASLQ